MIIQQLSIFLENKSGRLTELTKILAENGINISALSIAETSEYGMMRLVVSDPQKAQKVLKENLFSVKLTDVICLSTPNTAGSLHRALKILSDNAISVEYMYAFAMGEKAFVVIRTEDLDGSIKVLTDHKLELLKASDLYNI